MRYWTLAAAALIAVETAAIACSCLITDDPAELQRFAASVAEGGVALVEAEALTSFETTGTGERMRVIRTFAGTAPAQFIVKRRANPSSASCDILYKVGERTIVVLYPAEGPGEPLPVYRTSGLCSGHMFEKPAFREEVRRILSARTPQPERG